MERRKHGCQLPLQVGQTVALCIWFTVLAGCYALFIPIIQNTAAQAAVAAVYSLAALVVTGTHFVVSLTDPADHGSAILTPDCPLYCDSCQFYVSRSSKHCKECAKCVLGFDHHCKWVNNCIGSRNYKPFLALLTSMCGMLALQLGAGIYLLVECFRNPATTALQLAAAYPAYMDVRAYAAALLIYCSVIAAALYPLADLWLLHLVLTCRGITTWDYIMANRDASIEPSALSRGISRALRHMQSLGPRSRRVRDDSGISSKGSSSSSGGSSNSKKRKVGISPCLACRTKIRKVASRDRQGAYDHFFSSKDGSKPGGFDAAQLIFTPRNVDGEEQESPGKASLSPQRVKPQVLIAVSDELSSCSELGNASAAGAVRPAAEHAQLCGSPTAASSSPTGGRGSVQFAD